MRPHDAAPMVIVLDTDDRDREQLCEQLRDHGYRTVCASTVRDAVGHFEELPAVVVFSLDVPSSRDAKLQFVEAVPRGTSLILTSRNGDAAAALRLHAAPFLRKPFTIDAFVEKVAESSRRRRD